MSTPDQTLPADGRLYGHRHYQSVFPLPEWPELGAWKKQRQEIRRHLLLCAGLNAQTAAFKARGRIDFSANTAGADGVPIESMNLHSVTIDATALRLKVAMGAIPACKRPYRAFRLTRRGLVADPAANQASPQAGKEQKNNERE